jgi:hypothetical protein
VSISDPAVACASAVAGPSERLAVRRTTTVTTVSVAATTPPATSSGRSRPKSEVQLLCSIGLAGNSNPHCGQRVAMLSARLPHSEHVM